MSRMEHAIGPVLVISLTWILLTGCDIEPSKERIEIAEGRVEVARGPALLDASTINSLIASQKADGTTYNITGRVVSTEVKSTSTDSSDKLTVRITLRNPDYAAVKIDCFFSAKHEASVRVLSAGEEITVRGSLDSVGSSDLRFIGCILQEKPAVFDSDESDGLVSQAGDVNEPSNE